MAPGRNVPLVEAPKGITELAACVLLASGPMGKVTIEPSPHLDVWMFSCSGFISRHYGKNQNKEKSLLLPKKSKMFWRALE